MIIFLAIHLNLCFGHSKEDSSLSTHNICLGWEIGTLFFSIMHSYLEAWIRFHGKVRKILPFFYWKKHLIHGCITPADFQMSSMNIPFMNIYEDAPLNSALRTYSSVMNVSCESYGTAAVMKWTAADELPPTAMYLFLDTGLTISRAIFYYDDFLMTVIVYQSYGNFWQPRDHLSGAMPCSLPGIKSVCC